MKKTALIMVMSLIAFGFAGVVLAGTQANEQKKFEGDVTTVDNVNHTFTVKSGTEEMTFHVDPASHILVDDQTELMSDLERGDHVVVTYKLEGTNSIPVRINHRLTKKLLGQEMTFEGDIVSVDLKDETFTVRNGQDNHVEEMEFHADLDSRIMVNGTRTLLADLEKGDHVTVHYQMDGGHTRVSNVQKGAS